MKNDTAFIKNTVFIPPNAYITPPRRGPTTMEAPSIPPFIEFAFIRFSEETSSGIIAPEEELNMLSIMDINTWVVNNNVIFMFLKITNNESRQRSVPLPQSISIIIYFLFFLSPSIPENGDVISDGTIVSIENNPISVPEPVKSRIYNGSATI